jgi:hypothetical protein
MSNLQKQDEKLTEAAVRKALGTQLRCTYDDFVHSKVPERLTVLLDRLGQAEARCAEQRKWS